MKTMTRDEVIEALIADDVDTITAQGLNSEIEYLANILREGFIGYKKLGKEELAGEYEERLDPNDDGVEII